MRENYCCAHSGTKVVCFLPAVVFSRAFGYGTGVLCTYGCGWPDVRARKWCVRPQKEGILRTMFVEKVAYP